jgi:hypothetical protein
MRRFPALALLVSLAACGNSVTAPRTGLLAFKLDTVSCTSSGESGRITFYIEGSIVPAATELGTVSLSPGDTSPSYTVPAGVHGVSALFMDSPNIGYRHADVTVPANGSVTALVTCN